MLYANTVNCVVHGCQWVIEIFVNSWSHHLILVAFIIDHLKQGQQYFPRSASFATAPSTITDDNQHNGIEWIKDADTIMWNFRFCWSINGNRHYLSNNNGGSSIALQITIIPYWLVYRRRCCCCCWPRIRTFASNLYIVEIESTITEHNIC